MEGSRKRPREVPTDDEGPRKVRASAHPTFACPFYVHNRAEYSNCFPRKLTRISDLKQHIRRAHEQPVHCPRCGVIFPDGGRKSLDEHLRSQNCEAVVPKPDPPGVTPDQWRLLMTRWSGSKSSGEEAWYHIWYLLFPGSPRPRSPFAIKSPMVDKLMGESEKIFSSDEWEKLVPESLHRLEAMDYCSRRTHIQDIIDKFIKLIGAREGTESGGLSSSEQRSELSLAGPSFEQTPSVVKQAAPPTGGLERDRPSVTNSLSDIWEAESSLLLREGVLRDDSSNKNITTFPAYSKPSKNRNFDLRFQSTSNSFHTVFPESTTEEDD